MPMSASQAEFIKELDDSSRSCAFLGTMHNFTDIALSMIGIFASVVAAILTASEGAPKWLAACMAAVPAASTSLQRIVDFRGRSNWYYIYSASVRAMFIRAKYAKDPDLEKLADEWSEFRMNLERGWSRIGRTTATSPQHVIDPDDSDTSRTGRARRARSAARSG